MLDFRSIAASSKNTKVAIEMRWKIYIIETESGQFYTGITTDLERRFSEHRNKKTRAKFFSISAPKKIVYIEEAENRSLATKREIEIKKLTKKQKLKLVSMVTL